MAAGKIHGRGWRLALVCFVSATWGCGLGDPTTGVVVESCVKGEAAAAAGLRPGDVVVEWKHGRAGGEIDTPFRLALVEQKLAPHGPVELTVHRGSTRHHIEIPHGLWRLGTRPILRPNELGSHLEATLLTGSGDYDDAAILWATLAEDASEHGRTQVSAWMHSRTAVAYARAGDHEACRTALEAGAGLMTDSRLRAAFWDEAGTTLVDVGQTAMAAVALRQAIEILDAEVPKSPALAHALVQLCRTSLRSSLAEAERALEIYRRLGGETIETATALNVIGTAAFFRSDLDTAEAVYLESLESVRRIAPGSATELNLLGNLGLVAMRRGDFETARSYFLREEAAAEDLGTDTIQYAFASNYLGLLAKKVGRYEIARLHYEKALTSFQMTKPDGPEVAGVLTNLGNVALRETDFASALRYHEDALTLRRSLDPAGSDVAASLHNVGSIARAMGDLEHARRSLERALEIKLEIAPGTVWLSNTLSELGEVAREELRFSAAESLHREALEIRRSILPNDQLEAESLFALGSTEYAQSRLSEAERLWRESINIIEERRSRIRLSSEARNRFGAIYDSQYGSLARLLVEQGRTDEAWECLEKARAAELRSMVAHRETAPSDVPSELWFAKTRAEHRLSRLESRLATVDPDHAKDALLHYRDQLASVEAELERIAGEIRAAAPRYTDIGAPPTLTLDQLRQSLAPGTVVLTYTIGRDQSMAMVTGARDDGGTDVVAFDIPVGRRALRGRVDRFNALIARGRSVDEIEPALIAQARKLFEILVTPAWDSISTASRVLVVPDGTLHELPFSALVLPGEPARFLGHVKPLFINPSASLAIELGETANTSTSESMSIVALGDPHYPADSHEVEEYGLGPLPGARSEIEAIQRLFGSRATVFVGQDATEANLRAHADGPTVLHYAVHAHIDPLISMDSALFLSLPDGPNRPEEDGVLSAWEIIDTVHTGAGLVVLSSCGSARGRVVPGEGIIGLARAFQIAGARSLVASQWAVPDASTATLMNVFYEQLADGRSTVEALQRAQIEVGADSQSSHPFHWASFQLRGDWR